jgi:hypothetical protein
MFSGHGVLLLPPIAGKGSIANVARIIITSLRFVLAQWMAFLGN